MMWAETSCGLVERLVGSQGEPFGPAIKPGKIGYQYLIQTRDMGQEVSPPGADQGRDPGLGKLLLEVGQGRSNEQQIAQVIRPDQ